MSQRQVSGMMSKVEGRVGLIAALWRGMLSSPCVRGGVFPCSLTPGLGPQRNLPRVLAGLRVRKQCGPFCFLCVLFSPHVLRLRFRGLVLRMPFTLSPRHTHLMPIFMGQGRTDTPMAHAMNRPCLRTVTIVPTVGLPAIAISRSLPRRSVSRSSQQPEGQTFP